MNYIKIQSISDSGVAGKERVLFKAIGIDNVGKYIAFSTIETSPGKIYSNPKKVYWFPDQEVKSGDFIILYTGSGVNTKFANKVGTITYVFYWNLSETIFVTNQDTIALLRIESWEYKSNSGT